MSNITNVNITSGGSFDGMVLLITGCIAPVKQNWLKLTDSGERLNQYLESIEFYIERSGFRDIVFCDNSAYPKECSFPLYELASLKGKRFEWLSFQGNNELEVKRGKGYGEGEIIDYALSNSELLAGAKALFKVTGRLTVGNVADLLSGRKPGETLFVRNVYASGIDTRFYSCGIETYNGHFRHIYERVGLGGSSSIEDLFLGELNHLPFRSFGAYPSVRGCSGGNGIDYSKEPASKLRLMSALCKANLFNFLWPFWQRAVWHASSLTSDPKNYVLDRLGR